MASAKPTDDRSAPCRLADLSPRQIGWRALGLQSVTPDFITKHEQTQTAGVETAVALAGGAVGCVLYQFLIFPAFARWMTGWMYWLGWVVVPVVVAMIAWFAFLGKIRVSRADRIIGIYLSAGRCASCGYALESLEPEADGCVVCPECHAAWKADRVGTGHAPIGPRA